MDDFLNSEFWRNKKPAKIDHITFGTRKIFGQKYPGRKSWKGNENESSPPKDSPDGQFYNDIMQCLYEGHESTFEDTPLGKTVELEKRYNSESLFEREYTYFVVPQEIIEEPNGKFAIQTDYSKMWQNIKRAAEETGALEKLLIGFAG